MTTTTTRSRLARPPGAERMAQAMPKLFIAVPCYGSLMSTQTSAALAQLFMSLNASGMKFEREFMGNESLVTRARNRLVAQFLKSDCTHLLFIDADVGFSARDVDMLMRVDEDAVVGAYPMKTYGWDSIAHAAKLGTPADELPLFGALYAVNAKEGDVESGGVDVHQRNGARFVEVHDGATGFMLLRRAAVERFIAHYRDQIEYVADYQPGAGEVHHNVFHADRDPVALAEGKPARYLSEDYFFSRRWQMMGGKIFLCIDCRLTHTGAHTFRGDVSRLLEPADAQPSTAVANIEMIDPGEAVAQS